MHRGIIHGSILQTDAGEEGPLATLEPGKSIEVGSLNDVSQIFGAEAAPTPIGEGISDLSPAGPGPSSSGPVSSTEPSADYVKAITSAVKAFGG